MPTKVLAKRLIDAETAQYRVNDVVHLPELHARYLRRVAVDWLVKATEEGARLWLMLSLHDTLLNRSRRS